MSTIASLRAALREAEEKETLAAREAWDALPRQFEWRVQQKTFGFIVERRLDRVSREAHAAWCEQFPNISFLPTSLAWNGMAYHLLYTKHGDPVLIGQGGSIILNLQSRFASDPAPISHAQAELFQRGIVPEELKKG